MAPKLRIGEAFSPLPLYALHSTNGHNFTDTCSSNYAWVIVTFTVELYLLVRLKVTDAKLVGVALNGGLTERNSTWEVAVQDITAASCCVLPVGKQRAAV